MPLSPLTDHSGATTVNWRNTERNNVNIALEEGAADGKTVALDVVCEPIAAWQNA